MSKLVSVCWAEWCHSFKWKFVPPDTHLHSQLLMSFCWFILIVKKILLSWIHSSVSACLLKQQHVVINISESCFVLVMSFWTWLQLLSVDLTILETCLFQTSTALSGLWNMVSIRFSIQECFILYLHVLFFIQIVGLQLDREQLCFSGFSSEVQPLLPSETTGPESQRGAERFWSEAAVWSSGESTLQTGDFDVRQHFIIMCWL